MFVISTKQQEEELRTLLRLELPAYNGEDRQPASFTHADFTSMVGLLQCDPTTIAHLHICVLGWQIEADDLQLHGSGGQSLREAGLPLHFEVRGRTRRFVVTAWVDHVEVRLVQRYCPHEVLQLIVPQTAEELRNALQLIINDLL